MLNIKNLWKNKVKKAEEIIDNIKVKKNIFSSNFIGEIPLELVYLNFKLIEVAYEKEITKIKIEGKIILSKIKELESQTVTDIVLDNSMIEQMPGGTTRSKIKIPFIKAKDFIGVVEEHFKSIKDLNNKVEKLHIQMDEIGSECATLQKIQIGDNKI